MKSKIPITVAALAVACALAGCTPAAPSPTPPAAFSTLPAPGSAVREYTKTQLLAKLREIEANAAVGLLGGVDRGLANAAAVDRVPFVFAQDDTHSDACGQWLRLPDRSLWSLATGGALSRDTDLEQTLARWKGGLPAYACAPGTVTSVPPFDAVAADAASRSGRPYRWRDADACFDSIRVPGSTATFTMPETVSARGDALSAQASLIGCRVAPTTTIGGN